MSKKKFKESQRFLGWDIMALISFLALGLTYRFVEQFFVAQTGIVMSIWAYLFFMMFLGAGLWYASQARLTTEINKKHIKYKFYPFHKKNHKIRWNEVEDFQIIEMPLAASLSGWNVHFGGSEKRYCFEGRAGIQLQLKNGEHIFIGTRHPSFLNEVTERLNLHQQLSA